METWEIAMIIPMLCSIAGWVGFIVMVSNQNCDEAAFDRLLGHWHSIAGTKQWRGYRYHFMVKLPRTIAQMLVFWATFLFGGEFVLFYLLRARRHARAAR